MFRRHGLISANSSRNCKLVRPQILRTRTAGLANRDCGLKSAGYVVISVPLTDIRCGKRRKTRDNSTANSRRLNLGKCLAGVVGFEPTVHATKKRCLTTWLHPNCARFPSQSQSGTQPQISGFFLRNKPQYHTELLSDDRFAAKSRSDKETTLALILKGLIISADHRLFAQDVVDVSEDGAKVGLAGETFANDDKIGGV